MELYGLLLVTTIGCLLVIMILMGRKCRAFNKELAAKRVQLHQQSLHVRKLTQQIRYRR